jgi:hypothetical protein
LELINVPVSFRTYYEILDHHPVITREAKKVLGALHLAWLEVYRIL